MKVDRYLKSVSHSTVFAVGDVACLEGQESRNGVLPSEKEKFSSQSCGGALQETTQALSSPEKPSISYQLL